MGTTIRPELSEKNKYWIERHRYYELKHFCLQYPLWKNALRFLNAYPDVSTVKDIKSNKTSNPVLDYVETADYYNQRIKMVEDTAKEVDESLAEYLVKGVTEGLSYDNLRIRTSIPCCKDVYYELYRKFFWLLNKKRL